MLPETGVELGVLYPSYNYNTSLKVVCDPLAQIRTKSEDETKHGGGGVRYTQTRT